MYDGCVVKLTQRRIRTPAVGSLSFTSTLRAAAMLLSTARAGSTTRGPFPCTSSRRGGDPQDLKSGVEVCFQGIGSAAGPSGPLLLDF